jgi:hypothetical protein
MPDSDVFLDSAMKYRPQIMLLYRQFASKKPIMLFDRQEERIYAFPFVDFLKELSPRSQHSLKKQYAEALRNNQVVVFVRDNEQRRLLSYSFGVEPA